MIIYPDLNETMGDFDYYVQVSIVNRFQPKLNKSLIKFDEHLITEILDNIQYSPELILLKNINDLLWCKISESTFDLGLSSDE